MYHSLDRNSPVQTYMCPGRSRPMMESPGGAWSDYFYNNYLNDPKNADKADNPDQTKTHPRQHHRRHLQHDLRGARQYQHDAIPR